MEQEDSFVESVESLIETIKRLVVKPVKRIAGFASMGLLLVVFAFNGFGISYYWNYKNYAGAWVASWN